MAAAASKEKPRLRDLNELFRLDEGRSVVSENTSDSHSNPTAETLMTTVPFDRMDDFAAHPFRLYEDERKADMIESIRKNGILQPLILRDKPDGRYEILSGHNRRHCAFSVGITEALCVVKHSLSDEDAWIYVIETNLMQRSFSDMAHSEKAAVIALQHSKLFSQGKRNDIQNELKLLEIPSNLGRNSTSPQIGEKLHSDKQVGQMYSLSKNSVARYLRINYLITSLKRQLDDGLFGLIPAVTLSFLKKEEQQEIVKCVSLNDFNIDMKKADALRQRSEQGKLDDEKIYLILSGELGGPKKPNRTPTVKVRKDVYARYFKPSQSAKEVQDIVEKALEMYYSIGDQARQEGE